MLLMAGLAVTNFDEMMSKTGLGYNKKPEDYTK